MQPLERAAGGDGPGQADGCAEPEGSLFGRDRLGVPLASRVSEFLVQPLVVEQLELWRVESDLVDAFGGTTFVTSHTNHMAMASEWGMYGGG